MPSERAKTALVGQSISHYRILAKLGAGGMGEVYKAEDSMLGRQVAIKVLGHVGAGHGVPLQDPQARERFQREARAAAALNHPNICTIYEIAEHEGQPFIAMEYIEGRSLKEALALGPLPSGRVIEYGRQLAAALDHAHSHGILHRDIKSANVFLTSDNTIKLLDFGLAKATREVEATRSQLTAPGAWVGTLHYSPPEVLSGRPADFRSDIYSLGVVLYEMATGTLPFTGLDGNTLVAAVLRGSAPPVLKRNPALSQPIARIIERAMAARPNGRYQRASELFAAFRELESGAAFAKAEPGAEAAPSIAVLEFQNISGDPSGDWLCTGLAETLATDLKKIKQVRVVSRERVQEARRRHAGQSEASGFREIGQELGVRWLATGSFQRAGDRLRITPRLVEVETGEAVATGKIDGKWEDVFSLQDRVVSELMAALEVKVDSGQMERIARPETLQLEAFEHYAQGRKKWAEFGKDSMEKAREHFERAVALDPQYAVALAALGSTYAMRFIHRTDPDDLVRALGYLERATELDPELGDPYPFLCYVYMRQGKLEQSIRAGRKGVDLQPDLAQAHYFLGCPYMINAEVGEEEYAAAVRAFLDAGKADPGFLASWLNLAWIALMVGEYDQAERFLARMREIAESGAAVTAPIGSGTLTATCRLRRLAMQDARRAYQQEIEKLAASDNIYREAFMATSACGLGEIDLREGRFGDALAQYRRASRITKEYPRMLGNARVALRAQAGIAAALAAQGAIAHAQDVAREAKGRLDQISGHPETWVWEASLPQLSFALAIAFLLLGNPESSLALLETAVSRGWRDANWLGNDPELVSLRQNPRFQKLIAQVRSKPLPHFQS